MAAGGAALAASDGRVLAGLSAVEAGRWQHWRFEDTAMILVLL
jgi:hypothetical protein